MCTACLVTPMTRNNIHKLQPMQKQVRIEFLPILRRRLHHSQCSVLFGILSIVDGCCPACDENLNVVENLACPACADTTFVTTTEAGSSNRT